MRRDEYYDEYPVPGFTAYEDSTRQAPKKFRNKLDPSRSKQAKQKDVEERQARRLAAEVRGKIG